LPGVVRIEAPVEVVLTATYFDTPELRLLSRQMTLRRRSGGLDDGWHLKIPMGADQREEVRLPLGTAEHPPTELLARVRGVIRDAPVEPAAVLVTRRRIHRLLGEADVVLAEFCDDEVQATTSGESPIVQTWREWELELIEAPDGLLDAVGAVLRRPGVRPSTMPSKLARVLGDSLPSRPSWLERADLGARPDAGELLSAYVAGHLARLEHQDQLLRAGDQEGVHQMRVAARRIRSALLTYAPVLEPGPATELGAELRWLGGVLSEARDAQVLGERLRALVEQLPAHLVIGPVLERVSDELSERFRAGRVNADEALDGARYFRLLDQLEAFVDHPPLIEAAGARAARVVPDLIQRDLKRLHKRNRTYRAATSREDQDIAIHAVRKAAKRLRYAAESAQPVFRKRATRLAARAEALQELLGEHQDTIVSREALREIAIRAHEAGENTFTV
ncbi:MAG: CYTH and CHAD domain-containing protein, partial [Candidatus Phosphoribacter sp.]